MLVYFLQKNKAADSVQQSGRPSRGFAVQKQKAPFKKTRSLMKEYSNNDRMSIVQKRKNMRRIRSTYRVGKRVDDIEHLRRFLTYAIVGLMFLVLIADVIVGNIAIRAITTTISIAAVLVYTYYFKTKK